jgi:hypothetical protein
MFEDITEPTRDEMKETIADQARIISDLENELVNRERELRDTDKRNGEYIEMIDKMRELVHRYFDKYGKDLFEEWQEEQNKPKIEADLIEDDD